ncbi:hypothetical protein SERLADRAFT_479870 [Serpula lacrymans var. lacrymans S7.9]|uniref:Uncharacterized protein n=1 Tax=Serpula lacrymans var. lacrymans (strain S7.9) TaxID=578457 RepID=F8PCH2_SERL9|nr:uncharacterized protein SERLADRAFT_479870 [Serpula lacrymans var. lacrymans S7.9]EGO19370.1 hypothetical protein SERLADRAFT_479870 [Serpula lacrymans var. lacrymans S7.9]
MRSLTDLLIQILPVRAYNEKVRGENAGSYKRDVEVADFQVSAEDLKGAVRNGCHCDKKVG